MNVVGPAWQCPDRRLRPRRQLAGSHPNEHLSVDEYWKAVNVIEQTLIAFSKAH
jgi:hypothetical protein